MQVTGAWAISHHNLVFIVPVVNASLVPILCLISLIIKPQSAQGPRPHGLRFTSEASQGL